MDGWFLTNMWPTIPNGDKEALAAYLRNTKDTRDPRFIVSANDYQAYVRVGQRMLRKAS
jgi:hypothetical protein